jgi:hypothetical protein
MGCREPRGAPPASPTVFSIFGRGLRRRLLCTVHGIQGDVSRYPGGWASVPRGTSTGSRLERCSAPSPSFNAMTCMDPCMWIMTCNHVSNDNYDGAGRQRRWPVTRPVGDNYPDRVQMFRDLLDDVRTRGQSVGRACTNCAHPTPFRSLPCCHGFQLQKSRHPPSRHVTVPGFPCPPCDPSS